MDLRYEINDQIACTLSAHYECVYYVDINLLTKIKYLLAGFPIQIPCIANRPVFIPVMDTDYTLYTD